MSRMSPIANAAVLQALMDAGQASATQLMAASGYPRAAVVSALHALRLHGMAGFTPTRMADGSVCRIHSLTPEGIDAALAAAPAQI